MRKELPPAIAALIVAANFCIIATITYFTGWYLLIAMVALSLALFVGIIVQEKPWKYFEPWINTGGYAIMAFGAVFLGIPLIIINLINDYRNGDTIARKWKISKSKPLN